MIKCSSSSVILLVLWGWLVVLGEGSRVELSLRHFSGEGERPTALLYAGTPLRAVPLALRFTVPPEVGDAFASQANRSVAGVGSADAADLPGQYPALWLSPNDPVVTSARLGADASWDPIIGAQQLTAQPFVDTLTRGAALSLCLAVSPLAGGVARSGGGRARGVLALGPGSAAWLRWTYARLTRNTLVFSSERAPVKTTKATTPTVALACAHFDPTGRCVVDLSQHPFAIVPVGRANAPLSPRPLATPVRWLVLDLDSAAGELPPILYARLLHAASGASPSPSETIALAWGAPSAAPSLIIARADDVGNGMAGGTGGGNDDGGGGSDPQSATPVFVTRAALADDTIVLGRRSLTRLFAALEFDASAAVWTASPAASFNDDVRGVLTVLNLLQVVLLGYFFASPLNLGLAAADPWRSPRLPFFLLVPLALLSLVVAVAQSALGFVYAGAGFGADAVVGAAVERLAYIALVHVCVLAAAALFTVGPLLAVALWRAKERGRSLVRGGVALRSELGAAFAANFAACGLLGLVGGLAPLAAITMAAHLMLALLAVALLVPTVVYAHGALAACLVAFYPVRVAVRGAREALRDALLLGVYLVVGLASVVCLGYVSLTDALLPMLRAANVLYSEETVVTAGWVALFTALVVAFLLVAADARTMLTRLNERFAHKKKKR